MLFRSALFLHISRSENWNPSSRLTSIFTIDVFLLYTYNTTSWQIYKTSHNSLTLLLVSLNILYIIKVKRNLHGSPPPCLLTKTPPLRQIPLLQIFFRGLYPFGLQHFTSKCPLVLHWRHSLSWAGQSSLGCLDMPQNEYLSPPDPKLCCPWFLPARFCSLPICFDNWCSLGRHRLPKALLTRTQTVFFQSLKPPTV